MNNWQDVDVTLKVNRELAEYLAQNRYDFVKQGDSIHVYKIRPNGAYFEVGNYQHTGIIPVEMLGKQVPEVEVPVESGDADSQ